MRLQPTLQLLILFCCAPILLAQNSSTETDRLEKLLDDAYTQYYEYEYKKALESCLSLLNEARAAGNDYYIFRAYNKLGSIHNSVKDTAHSRIYFEKALQHALEIKSDSLISWGYNDLANVYAEDPLRYLKTITLYKEGIKVNQRAGLDDYENLTLYMNIGWTYLDVERPDAAFPYLQKTKELSKQKKQHPLFLINLDILFGRYYFYTDPISERAIQILEETAGRAVKGNYLEQAATSYKYLAKLYNNSGDLALANSSLLKQLELKEKLHKHQMEAQLNEATAKFELQQYQNDLAVARNEQVYADRLVAKSRLLVVIFAVAFIILFSALVVFYKSLKARKRFISKLHDKNVELTRAKEKAERLSLLKTQFFSTVSHELRTPLYGVIGISSLLLDNKKLNDHRNDLQSLKFSADYLLALINDVLTLNKIEANGIRLEHNAFHMGTLMNNIIRSFAFGLEQNNNQLHLRIDSALPDSFVSDSVRLSQILMNLVGNAVKFNENGNIWVTIHNMGETKSGNYKVYFEVKDDGIGIPKEQKNAIFEEFSQMENKNYNYQGTGLGLSIVKKLLSVFGSEIRLESELGAGATFSFEIEMEAIPSSVVEARELSHETYETLTAEEHFFDNFHILVVDDNKINQKITQKILETRNFQCSLANDGEEAIVLTREGKFDLILMDIHMPRMNGIEATKIIREFDQSTPIVALTAVEVAEMRKSILESGMNDIILKPYDVSQFLNTLFRNLSAAVGHNETF